MERYSTGFLGFFGPECALPAASDGESEACVLRKEAAYFGLQRMVDMSDDQLNRAPSLLKTEGLQENGRYLMHPLTKNRYHGSQFRIENPVDFRFQVKVGGNWARVDSFFIGVACQSEWSKFVESQIEG
eukprot:gnl/MRDRNA2_/MRDRNA2_329837_c0_seq1.p1 gnl/MRDRNA2_/MRDRNA2_329837_c0~~gnl/MRDRNA2_/MRDRNA2_329837_c0_seq1.p1  ORF type:complete len:129 (+),score=22.57 gnl/MRDRNA2_/MRDRNA2_329837_c0_seq1:371-757(+)